MKLVYDKPIECTYDEWEKKALPLGNSSIGASIFGAIENEEIWLNEKSLWSGGPAEGRNYQGGNLEELGRNGQALKEIRQLFKAGKVEEATSLCEKNLVGLEDELGEKGYGNYLRFGRLIIRQDLDMDKIISYRRELDLDRGEVRVSFSDGKNWQKRKYLISYPAQVMAVEIDNTFSSDIEIQFIADDHEKSSGARQTKTKLQDESIQLVGRLKDNQLIYVGQVMVSHTDGVLVKKAKSLLIRGASKLEFFINLQTNYKNIYPNYRDNRSIDEIKEDVAGLCLKASKKGFEAIRDEHQEDYKKIFNRLKLDIGQAKTKLMTDDLLLAYKDDRLEEEEKRYLEVLLFQYGRYLLISSSREKSLPANLQGIWSGDNRPAWHGDYHLNINLQMNYWPAMKASMAETAISLIDYIFSLREPGRLTAKIYAGIDNGGFVAHTQNNPYGWTCPGWNVYWGFSIGSVAWLLQTAWEYYLYTKDRKRLEEQIYPMIKDTANFYQAYMEEDEGKYIVSPAYSPEHGPITRKNTYEQSLVYDFFMIALEAAKEMQDKEAWICWQEILEKIYFPIEIGREGQIKEWYDEDDNEVKKSEGFDHRHISHLIGLCPGNIIGPNNSKFIEAAKLSLDRRTEKTTGWGLAHRINSWARSKDGERAYKALETFIKTCVYPNLWASHPPFQIDGNFGYVSAICQMLLQENKDKIDLLPALPKVWSKGKVSGFALTSNRAISFEWADDKIISSKINEMCI